MSDKTDAPAHEDEYDDALVTMLELVWGAGFLSPGGPEDVEQVIAGLDLAGKLVLDVGCGIGGVDLILARDHGARIIGLDLEEPLLARARKRFEEAGLADRGDFRRVEPGPIPLDDASVDVVFGKDAWVQIPDKPALFSEFHRVLRPAGVVAAGDWMLGEGKHADSDDMLYFYKLEGITYNLDTFTAYGQALSESGFVDVVLTDISEDYRQTAHHEYEQTKGALRERMIELLGPEKQAHFEENWRALTVVLDNGELRPGQIRARKPG